MRQSGTPLSGSANRLQVQVRGVSIGYDRPRACLPVNASLLSSKVLGAKADTRVHASRRDGDAK